jgi:hypothetical protein
MVTWSSNFGPIAGKNIMVGKLGNKERGEGSGSQYTLQGFAPSDLNFSH